MLNESTNRAQPLSIAVAGAAGRVGRRLISQLAQDLVTILALTRQKSPSTLPAKVAFAELDFDHPLTLRRALVGVEKLFIAHGTSPQQVANEIALIDAAVETGVQHIVKLSVKPL